MLASLAQGAQRGQLTHGLDATALLCTHLREVQRELDEGLTEWLCALAPATPPRGRAL